MSDEPKPPVRTRLCCAQATLHIHRRSEPIPGLADENGIEMQIALGSSVEGHHKCDLVALLDANNRVIGAAPLDRVPEIGRAMRALMSAALDMFAHPEHRAAAAAASVLRSDGVKN